MDSKKDSKRKKDKENDYEDRRKEKKSRRHRSRSRSADDRKDNWRKRKHSRSRSPKVPLKQEKLVESEARDDAVKKEAPVRKAKETDMLNTRTGGAYIPPARLRMMQAQITDKSSVAYQRLAWEALKKSIHGHINKINVGNIGIIIKELLKENIVRGRGLLCRSVIQAQAASPTFTNVYAALVAAVNSRFPNIGELLLKRLVIQFKRGFKRNDKPTCISSASFIAHLVNQRVAHEILALELLTLLVESPTDDSVEVAIAFLKECGQKLTEVSSKGVNAIFEMLRNILHEGQLDKRVQYMIEVMFQVWKDGFKDHPALIEELELVPEEEQFTHLLMLDDATDPQDILNVFKFDDKYEDNEQKYKTLSKEILGSDAESGEEDGSGESGSEESDDEEEQEGEQKGMTIIDNTETNLVALRRTIYLTINSSLDFEECAHKLMKMQLKPGQEVELCHMFLDCCAEQRTYEKFYGLLAQRFCNINRMYIGPFEEIFKDSYATAHRLDTNRLRNVSKFFAHLLFTDSISWEVMECVKLNEEDTTSSSRIYIKILFQELAEYMGLKKLNDRLKDPTLQTAFSGIFPRDNPKNTRFSINFFTSIGLGGLTDELREHLKQMPKNVPAPVTDINVESDSSSDSSSSSSSSDSSSSESSSSDSEDEGNKKKKSKKSKEKDKSKQSPSQGERNSNKEKNDIEKERWGHDGFYNTYGENAKRHDNRSERPEQGRDNFAKPRDVSRRYDEREKQNANERGNRSDRYRDEDRRRQDRAIGGEELKENRKETDGRSGKERERRSDSTSDRRNERHSGDDNRYDKEKSRNRNDREDRRRTDDNERKGRDEEKKQDKNQRRNRGEDSSRISESINDDKSRDRNAEKEKRDKSRNDKDQRHDREEDSANKYNGDSDNRNRDRNTEKDKRDKDRNRRDRDQRRDQDEDLNNRYNRDNYDRSGDRNSERERRDKDIDRINRGKENDKKKNSEEDLSTKTKDKNSKRDERDNRSPEKRKDQGKYSKGSSKTDKYYNSTDEEDLRSHRKDRKQESMKSRDIEEQNTKENRNKKDRKNKKDKKKKKQKDKKGKQESSDESDSSSEESESETDDSDIENKKGDRYWDNFDIENRETVQKQTKVDKRSSKIKQSGSKREQ